MGIFDKLKNVFFEEEQETEEVEENEIKTPVAKKIDVSEAKKNEEVKKETNNKLDLDVKIEEPIVEKEKDFKFPMGFDDKDFEVEKTIEIFGPVKEKEEPVIESRVESDEPPIEEISDEEYSYEEVRYNEPIRKEVKYSEPIREVVKQEVREEPHKLYEGKEREDKPGFTPSPIISPIYGILNKNYKKEQIVTKSEMMNSHIAKKDNLDIIREKAYGDLAGDISASIEDEIIDIEEDKPKEKENLVYDLNAEDSPTVKTVTVGDAEEYFNDLGLEYNVDYKIEKEEEKKEEQTRTKRVNKIRSESQDDENEKNLFDLIDAMYEDEESK